MTQAIIQRPRAARSRAKRAPAPLRNPRAMALAYRIWAHAAPRGWNCTIEDLAEAMDVTVQQVGVILYRKGWAGRLRVIERATERQHKRIHAPSFLMAEAREQSDALVAEARELAGTYLPGAA